MREEKTFFLSQDFRLFVLCKKLCKSNPKGITNALQGLYLWRSVAFDHRVIGRLSQSGLGCQLIF